MNRNEPNTEPEATPQEGGLPSTALLCTLNEQLKKKMNDFAVKHGHGGEINLHFDGSGAIEDNWGNVEYFDNLFEFLLA